MARTDSFFIRADVAVPATTFGQAAIDLGAYVDALGKSVLRIHNIQVQYGSAGSNPVVTISSENNSSFQLTTQSQSDLVDLSNRSVVASGRMLTVGNSVDPVVAVISETLDTAPQEYTEGYLIAVEQMYLGVKQTAAVLDKISIVLECTVETMTQAAAMALALSQQ